MPTMRRPWAVTLVGLALVLAGCGSSHAAISTGGTPSTTATTAVKAPTPTMVSPPASSPTASTSTTTTPSTTTTEPSIRDVRWADVKVPGSVCDGSGSIQLHDFKAQVAAPAALHAGTADAVVLAGPVTYGDLLGRGQDAAALYVWCDNTGGTADGQRQSSWVIFVAGRSGPRAVGILTPQQPEASQAPHVPYFDGNDGNLVMTPGRIVVHELWYATSDGSCCPSIRATSVWHYAGGHLQHVSTTA